jgi:hypothetical protein
MARIRSIHPDFPSDKKLATVSRDARLTYASTWCIADDAGLFRANPRQLLGQLYPYDEDVTEAQLEAWLVALVDLGLIRWHTTRDGARVGEIVNWPKRQKIDRPSKSFLQAELHGLATDSGHPREPRTKDTRESGEPGATPSRPESRVLSPEPRVLSPESGAAALRARLPVAYHKVLDGYLRAAQYPDALAAAILAEGPDTGTNGAPGKTWDVIGRALLEMRAAGKPFTPALLRAFCRKLIEPPRAGAPVDDSKVAGQLARGELARTKGTR